MILSSDTWIVGVLENHRKKQKISSGNQFCVVSAERKASVAVLLSTLVEG